MPLATAAIEPAAGSETIRFDFYYQFLYLPAAWHLRRSLIGGIEIGDARFRRKIYRGSMTL